MNTYPSETMSPVAVTNYQLRAMQEGNGRLYWRFVSPEGKRATGVLRPSRRAYMVPPKYAELPLYSPMMNARKFEVVGALNLGANRYQCRARVWPAGGERECAGNAMDAPPVEYIWHLAKQPFYRPTCYEDDPMQQGISTGPPFGGCWLCDEVRLDERRGGGGGGGLGVPSPPAGGGVQRRLPRLSVPARTRCPAPVAMASSDRPAILDLPAGVGSVDDLTAEALKGFNADDLQAALEQLEVAIFDSPPFEKPNEVARRRNLALAYWLKGDEAYYPRLIPNAKEVLRQLKGNDAEMQYILGSCILATMEGDPSKALSIKAFKRALELDPTCTEAAEALARASGGAAEEPEAATPEGFEWGITL